MARLLHQLVAGNRDQRSRCCATSTEAVPGKLFGITACKFNNAFNYLRHGMGRHGTFLDLVVPLHGRENEAGIGSPDFLPVL